MEIEIVYKLNTTSVLSLQLYMVPDIRSSVLAAEGAVTDMEEDFSGDEKQDTEVGVSES